MTALVIYTAANPVVTLSTNPLSIALLTGLLFHPVLFVPLEPMTEGHCGKWCVCARVCHFKVILNCQDTDRGKGGIRSGVLMKNINIKM